MEGERGHEKEASEGSEFVDSLSDSSLESDASVFFTWKPCLVNAEHVCESERSKACESRGCVKPSKFGHQVSVKINCTLGRRKERM